MGLYLDESAFFGRIFHKDRMKKKMIRQNPTIQRDKKNFSFLSSIENKSKQK